MPRFVLFMSAHPGVEVPDLPLVFVVDDEPEILALVALQLRASSVRVLQFTSSSAARIALRTERPALLICDLQLPGEGGERVLRECRGVCPGAQLIVLTAAGEAERTRVSDHGLADAVLEKPWHREELVRTVHLMLGLEPRPPSSSRV